MTLSSTSNPQLRFETVLSQVAIASREKKSFPPVTEVVNALLEAEKNTKKQHLSQDFSGLNGQWRLCFTTGVKKQKQGGIKLSQGFYLPRLIAATIGFNQTEISNQLKFLGFTLRFTGPLNYSSKRNLVYFDFLHLQIKLGNFGLFQGNVRGGKEKLAEFSSSSPLPQKLLQTSPFFTFFAITPQWIAARGRGGGLALWVKEE